MTVYVGSPADVDPPLIDPVAPDTATTGIPSSGIEVLGRSHTGHEFVARVLSEMPDVAVVDVRLDDVDAHAVCRRLHEWAPAVRLVAVGPLDDERLFGALVNGASSAVLLDEPPELAGSVVIGTARGESRILPRMAFRLLHDIDAWARRSADPLYPPPQLTATEREVLGRLGDGDDPATIATLHHVTAHLVNIHTGYAVAKLHRYVLGADRAPTGG
ncbi:MAG: DNA-binding response regulator [Actinomyces sp.]|nr:MAG: DNA-binding response regulator [Actinomyces sp.]